MKRLFYIFILSLFCNISLSQEICNNGIDDDFDGLIDLNDTTDCDCNIGYLPPIIPNPSFESFSACPTNASQMTRVNSWQDAVSMSSCEYFNCSYNLPISSPPYPNGTGAVGFAVGNGNGKEYFGTCLLDTLHAGVSYILQFEYAQVASFSARPIAIFGSSNCANLPFPATPVGPFGLTTNCPSLGPNWVTLDTLVPLINNAAWNTYSFTFTPSINVTSIIIGPSCAILSSPVSQAYYGTIDNLQLSYLSPTVSIDETGHYCRNNLVLTTNYDSVPNSFQWYKNGIALVNDTTSTYSVPAGGTGDYQILLNYGYGCLLSAFHKVDSTIIEFDYDSIGSCINAQTGSIHVENMIGGTPSYQFNNNSSPFKLDSNFTSLAPGIYTITVRDSNLCSATKSIEVNAFPAPISNFSSDTVCLGFPTTFTDKSLISKGTISGWNWDSPINSTTQNTTHTFPSSGIFPVTLTSTSDSGCIQDTTINIVVNPLPIIDFSSSPTSVYTFDTKVCFINNSTGAINYLWNFDFAGPFGISVVNSPCPIVFPRDKEDSYKVTLIGINQFGCIDSITKSLIIKDDFTLYIPNSFSPNGDKTNDELTVIHQGITSLEWRIFNRWGEVIFYSTDLNATWDGTHNGQQVSIGSYPYKILVKSNNGETKEIIGHINIIK